MIISNSCFINVYLPSATNSDESGVLLALFSEIEEAIIDAKNNYAFQKLFLGGDINVNIKCKSKSSILLNEFARRWGLTVCNDITPTNI